MTVHCYHDDLPGFDERQILHDGCEECEARGADVVLALGHMDPSTFRRAWYRASMWEAGRGGVLGRVSRAEAPVLRVINAVRVKAQESGVNL